jgi:hypothetical protein
MSFRSPTTGPIIDIRLPPGFSHVCNFGVPDERIISSSISQRYRLDGTQFPGQNMRIRWWRTTSVSDPSLSAAPLS